MKVATQDQFALLLLEELSGRGTQLSAFDDHVMAEGARTVLRNILDHITDYEIEDESDGRFATACHDAAIRGSIARGFSIGRRVAIVNSSRTSCRATQRYGSITPL